MKDTLQEATAEKTPPVLFDKNRIKTGLSDEEVKISREKYGSNVLTPPARKPLWQQYLEKFHDPTIILLGIAAILSIIIGVFKGHYLEGIGIILAIFLATGVSFYSEYKSGKEFDILNQIKEDTSKVIRNGKFHAIPTRDIVTGDMVLMEPGDKIPADGHILECFGLYIDESTLTGESEAARKYPAGSPKLAEKKETGFPRDMVYRGTTVSDGSGKFLVTAVGDKTELGKIAVSLQDQEEQQTPLQEKLEVLSKQIGYVGMGVAFLIFVALIVKHLLMGDQFGWNLDTLERLLQYFMITVTIIVVAVPEGLPMMVSMSLAFNMSKMAKANCLVKSLAASETIGSATVICSDKTGTLTQNRMKAVWFYINGNVYNRDQLTEVKNNPQWQSIITNIAVNSTAHLETLEDGTLRTVGNATEGALLNLLGDVGQDYNQLREKINVVRQVPFSSARKRMITVAEKPDKTGFLCYEKGAPSILLEECSHCMLNGEKVPIDPYRQKIKDEVKSASSQAYRVLAFTQKDLKYACDDSVECCFADYDHVFLGLIGIADPLRPHVDESVEVCHKAGIDVKMITGDDINTAGAIARECKIVKSDEDIIMTSKEFQQLSDEELIQKLKALKVVARSRPLDKLRLVKALQSQRETVGVTGDGTNDAPALKQSDVGIAMGKSGTEVAKESADIILVDDNFRSIVNGIHWGRTIFENIQRLIQFQLTVNFVALTVAFLGPFLGVDFPLTVVQLLWVNIIMDTFAALALSAEPPRPDTMKRYPKSRDEHIITPQMASYIVMAGIFMSAVLLILLKSDFLTTEAHKGDILYNQTILFTTFVMFQIWNEFNCRALSASQSPFKGLSQNKGFIIIIAIIFISQIIMVHIGGGLFRTKPLEAETWFKIILLTFSIIPMGYIIRFINSRLFKKGEKKV